MARKRTGSQKKLIDVKSEVGPEDKNRQMEARRQFLATGSGAGMGRTAGMMMSPLSPIGGGYAAGNAINAYRTSYASGDAGQSNSLGDVPMYFRVMNEKNGGLIQWPVTLREKYEWYRYWYRSNAYIGRGIELITDLPLSKTILNMPKMEGQEQLKEEINLFYTDLCSNLNLFQLLHDMMTEYHLLGNAVVFLEWDEEKRTWANATILPPEEIRTFKFPFQKNAWIEYRPQRLIEIVRRMSQEPASEFASKDDKLLREIYEGIPDDLKQKILQDECITFDSEPIIDGKVGSFCFHLARNKSPYMELGVSVLERLLIPLLVREHYLYTQLSLTSRNMTPKNKICVDTNRGLSQKELDQLREQVDLSYLDPEYTIITSYPFTWEQIGSDNRLIDFSREQEDINNQIFAALGCGREMITGEGNYASTQINTEILNTMFLQSRVMMSEFVENKIFKPIAEAHGWYKISENGVKTYWCPKLGFSRLTIRDNAEVFDSLFQLYQKGSLPLDYLLDLFNIDAEAVHERLKKDAFTIKDPTFNQAMNNLYGAVGDGLAEKTDVIKKVAEYFGLKFNDPDAKEGEEEDNGGGDMGGNMPAPEDAPVEPSSPDSMDFGGGEGGGGEPPAPEPPAEGPAPTEGGEGGGESGGGNEGGGLADIFKI